MLKTPQMRNAVAGFLVALASFMAGSTAVRADDTPLLSLGVGQFDHIALNPGFLFFDVNKHKGHDQAADFRLEYRFGKVLVPALEPYVKIKPWIGAEVTSDGGTYGAGGVLFDVPLGSSFMFTPSFGAGLFSKGNGKDMGSAIEFRTQFELGYVFANQSRLTAAFSHISNANISDTNPGANLVGAYYHMPASWLLGQ